MNGFDDAKQFNKNIGIPLMPTLKTKNYGAFKASVQFIAANYLSEQEVKHPKRFSLKKTFPVFSHTPNSAVAIRDSKLSGLEFLHFFKSEFDKLSQNSPFKQILSLELPNIVALNDQTLDYSHAFDEALTAATLMAKTEALSITTTSEESALLETAENSPASAKSYHTNVNSNETTLSVEQAVDDMSLSVSASPTCPITLAAMKMPVIASDGYVYDYDAIRTYYDSQQSMFKSRVISPVDPALALSGVFAPLNGDGKGIQSAARPWVEASDSEAITRSANMKALFQFRFNQSALSKIEIGINFINVYSQDAILIALDDNVEIKQNIVQLTGKHGREFSICRDHGDDHSYKNAIFMKSNQRSERNHYHPIKKEGSHVHYVYGRDVVSLQDLKNVFSYVQKADPMANWQKDFLEIADSYIYFTAKKILKSLNGNQAALAHRMIHAFAQWCEALVMYEAMQESLFTESGQLNRYLSALIPDDDTWAENMKVIRRLLKNDYLFNTITALVRDLNPLTCQLQLQPNNFVCPLPPPLSLSWPSSSSNSSLSSMGSSIEQDVETMEECAILRDLADYRNRMKT